MSELRLSLLGQAAIHKDGLPVTGFKSSKAVALLCYLAITGQPMARTMLVGLLWSELGEANALMNLRHVLANLRELVGEHLVITRQTVAFQRERVYWLDVEAFERGVNSSSLEELHAALTLYRGDFLAGLEVRQAPLFEAWRTEQQTRLRDLAVTALQTVADQTDDPALAITYTRQLLLLAPWHEEAHRHLMELLARSGHLNAALAHYESCRQVLGEQLAVEPAPATTALYERLRTATQTPAYHLPVQTTPFVGRNTELALIARYLADPVCRCLTLVGPGGMGKTRLALTAVAGQLSAFLHGVVFVSLTAVSAPAFMASAIAAALQLPLHGQEEPTQQLLHYLQNREMLLLLDNLEHLLAGSALLAEILTQAPHVKILATSRERLNLKAEWVMDIGGLTFPEDEATRPLQEYSGVQLFLETARRVQTHFMVNAANTNAIGRICRVVEGMPLGIELAAAWVRTLTCDEIAGELGYNLDLLTTTQPDVPARHQSMRAVFAHSWGLLPTVQQTLLGELAVFRRGFRQEAARAICAASLRDLAALVDKSLLQRDEVQGRFVLHELLRQFAADKHAMTVAAEHQAVEQRHCHYYLTWLADHTDALQGEEPHLAVAAILPELENIRQAWHWAVVHGEWEALGRALAAWRNFYHLRGLYTEAGNWLTEALHHWPVSTDEPSIAAPWQTVKGRLLLYAAEILVLQAHYPKALDQAEAADKLAMQLAAPGLKGQAQAMLGLIRRLQGTPALALIHQQRAAPLLQQSGARRLYAQLLVEMGKSYEQLHEWDKALDLQGVALRLFEELGDSWGSTMCWRARGGVYYGAGNLEQALACHQHALSLAQRIQASAELVRCNAEIGEVCWRIGRYAQALAHLQQTLVLAAALGLRNRVSVYHRWLGEIYKELRQFDKARTHLEQAVQLAQRANTPSEQSAALGTLAWVADGEGDTQAALDYSQRARLVAESSGDVRSTAIYSGLLARFYAKLGHLQLARELLETAVSDLQGLGMRANEPALPHNLYRLADILYQQGDYAMAEARCHAALAILQAYGQAMFQSKEIALWTTLTLAHCRYAQGQRAEAIQHLLDLLPSVTDPAQQAKLQASLARFQ